MQAIYKVIDKELANRIKEAHSNVAKGMTEKLAKTQELIPEVENFAITKSPIDGKHCIVGFTLKKGSDDSMFKRVQELKDREYIYQIKNNTKKGKELNKQLSFIGKSELLFDEKQFEEELNYKPAKREEFDNGFMTFNFLRFGFAEVDGETVFVFRGHDGYKPNDKVQEMTISEYNKMFGR